MKNTSDVDFEDLCAHLGTMIESGDLRLRRDAVQVLGTLAPGERVTGLLLEALSDAEARVRRIALRALAHPAHASGAMQGQVRLRLFDGDEGVREAASDLLRQMDSWVFEAEAAATAAVEEVEATNRKTSGEVLAIFLDRLRGALSTAANLPYALTLAWEQWRRRHPMPVKPGRGGALQGLAPVHLGKSSRRTVPGQLQKAPSPQDADAGDHDVVLEPRTSQSKNGDKKWVVLVAPGLWKKRIGPIEDIPTLRCWILIETPSGEEGDACVQTLALGVKPKMVTKLLDSYVELDPEWWVPSPPENLRVEILVEELRRAD